MHYTHMNNLAAFRELRGLTQAELAEMVELHQTTIQRAETEHPSAKLTTFKKCAKAFGIPLEQLFTSARSELEMELHHNLSQIPIDRLEDVRSLLRIAAGRVVQEEK